MRSPDHSTPGLTRRAFLQYGSAAFALPCLPQSLAAPKRARFRAHPFALGVASGDPAHDGLVLWTRLAPEPLAGDGGMPPEPVEVSWQLASDERMQRIVQRGTATADPALGHSVHVEVGDLAPDRWYWFRFHVGGEESPIGRTRTMPAPTASPDRLAFAFASCQHYETGLYTAYEHMAAQDLDFVVHLGDYIYEGKGRDGQVRKHAGDRLLTLADYRIRHAQYRSDPLLHGMHARCPWLVTWDDHEFENNYAGAISSRKDVDPAAFLQQRAAAYQAYYEAMPLRAAARPTGPDMRLYRRASFGRLAEFFVLDTRQYRTDQPNGDGRKPLNAAALAEANTLLGDAQREWLLAGLSASRAQWNVLAQQVMMGLVAFPPARPGDGKAATDQEPRYSMDQWPGYANERARLLRFLGDRKIANPIVLTGDIHSHWVNDLRLDDRDPNGAILATEFVGTSISSGGDGKDAKKELAALQPTNPGLHYLSRQRGYVLCDVTRERWRADYHVVDQVTKPGGKVARDASFTVAAGRAGVRAGRG